MKFLKNAKSWKKALDSSLSKDECEKIETLLARNDITPPAEKVFRALDLTPYNKVKVVILGQDPYPQQGMATGLAFAVSPGIKPPKSLESIFKCVVKNYPDSPDTTSPDTTLESWAKQGVLLLNTSLTTKIGKSAAHLKEWQPFVSAVIQSIINREKPVVFLVWGGKAKKMIGRTLKTEKTAEKVKILYSSHPNPRKSETWPDHFLKSKCFLEANEFLENNNENHIDWLSVFRKNG